MLELQRRGYVRAAATANCGHPAGQYDVALVDWRRRTFKTLPSSCSGSVRWAFGTIRSHPDHPGKMLTLRDSSARSAANVSTT
jgi:hypothetical protein